MQINDINMCFRRRNGDLIQEDCRRHWWCTIIFKVINVSVLIILVCISSRVVWHSLIFACGYSLTIGWKLLLVLSGVLLKFVGSINSICCSVLLYLSAFKNRSIFLGVLHPGIRDVSINLTSVTQV